MDAPFRYGILADKEFFIDRDADRKELKQLLSSGINTMLISPRRWGKSSLVKKAMNELMLERKDIKVCFIDAFRIHTEEEFYQTYASEVLKATSGPLEQCIADARHFLQSLSPSITIGSDPNNSVSFDLKLNFQKDSEFEILNLPEKIAVSKRIRVIVCIDEFQNLAFLRNYKELEGKMRSAWQQHTSATYCFYGSKRHMMMEIFNTSSNPFYRFGQVLFLKKIATEEWVDFIVHAFEKTGKSISPELALMLTNTVRSHSWYVQQLAYFVWVKTEKVTDSLILRDATEQIISTNLPLFINDCENLLPTQIAILKAVTNGENKLSSASVIEKYHLGNLQTITRNKRRLQEMDIMDKTGDEYSFVDPVFEIWFKEQYN